MIPVLFVGIAAMFLLLALASRAVELSLKKPHDEMLKVMEREIAREKEGAQGWASIESYLYKTLKWHYVFEIAGFVVAALAALLEYLLAIGWH
jgi:hypothetical protein